MNVGNAGNEMDLKALQCMLSIIRHDTLKQYTQSSIGLFHNL